MKRKTWVILTIAVIMISILVFIGCSGGGGGSDSGTSPTNPPSPTGTGTTYDNTYTVLTDQSRADGKFAILPDGSAVPQGYVPAPGAYIRFIDENGILVTKQVNNNGQFDAKAFGIPGITGSGNITSIATVDVEYNGEEETDIPVPVFEGEIPVDPGPIVMIKILPPTTMIREGGRRAFFCMGITQNGMIVPVTNVNWSVDDESIMKIVETPRNGSICVVEGVQGGNFPEPAFAYLTAEAAGGTPPPPPTESPTITPPSPTVTSTEPEPEPTETEERQELLTDTAKIGVVAEPDKDATITGKLLDSDGNPVANAMMVFRSSQAIEPDEPVEPGDPGDEAKPYGDMPIFMSFIANTDESGNFTVGVMSGQSYSVLAMKHIQVPIPTWSPDQVRPTGSPTGTPTGTPTGPGPGPQPGQDMMPYLTSPDPYGPVSAGASSQDFTLVKPIGPGPIPTPPEPTGTPIPVPSITPIPEG